MRYVIITNPASGKTTVDQKRLALSEAADILGCEIHGLDTTTSEELRQCAQELITHCDIIVVAGGDGTLSDIINSIDTAQTPIGFLPLGTGNAIKHALNYKGSLADIAIRIKNGMIHQFDLINCDEKRRAFMASIGIEGTIIRIRDQYLAQGITGFRSYLQPVLKSYAKEYKRTVAKIAIDGETFKVTKLLTLMVVKQGYYGFGMNVVPKARFDDNHLHILCIDSGLLKCSMGVATAFTIGNRIGRYRTGRQVTIKLERPLLLQLDGNAAWEAEAFSFTILPKALKIRC